MNFFPRTSPRPIAPAPASLPAAPLPGSKSGAGGVVVRLVGLTSGGIRAKGVGGPVSVEVDGPLVDKVIFAAAFAEPLGTMVGR